jgi:hypothetical protein
MSELVVEIHVPLTPDPSVAEGEYPFPWIDIVMDYLFALEDGDSGASMHDDGEEWNGEYVFFIDGTTEEKLLEVAADIAKIPGVPLGVYATVSDSEPEDFGLGRRIDLS